MTACCDKFEQRSAPGYDMFKFWDKDGYRGWVMITTHSGTWSRIEYCPYCGMKLKPINHIVDSADVPDQYTGFGYD